MGEFISEFLRTAKMTTLLEPEVLSTSLEMSYSAQAPRFSPKWLDLRFVLQCIIDSSYWCPWCRLWLVIVRQFSNHARGRRVRGKVQESLGTLAGNCISLIWYSLLQFETPVMVNFVCQLDWAKGIPAGWWKHYFLGICKGVPRRD
jgi:hypothetical protein